MLSLLSFKNFHNNGYVQFHLTMISAMARPGYGLSIVLLMDSCFVWCSASSKLNTEYLRLLQDSVEDYFEYTLFDCHCLLVFVLQNYVMK